MARQTVLALGGATRGPIIEQQLIEKQRTIDYDTKEYTVELLVNKFDTGDFFIPPYQRAFVWHPDRQSKFVESVLLGLPIPFMFGADTAEGLIEVVDGAQRLYTLSFFMTDNLRLRNLEILTELEGCIYGDVPPAQQRKFKNRTLRMIVLSDRTTPGSKFNIFERINTGSDSLRSSEVRKGAYSGPFYNFIDECAWKSDFVALCPVGEIPAKRGERQELVLRFFAYSERYLQFSHSVKEFLNKYMSEKSKLYSGDDAEAQRDRELKRERFSSMLTFVRKHFVHGFAKGVGATTTPRVRFEAISVGVALALEQNPKLVPRDLSWLASKEFERHTTTHASNSAPRLRGRIEFVRDRLLGA
jgi:hypothetical protein